MQEKHVTNQVISKCVDYIETGKHINDNDSSHMQAHFTPYNQLVISQIKSETVNKSVFAVDNYELPKLNRKMKPICETHEKGFPNWEEYRKHLIDKHSINGVFKCDKCSKNFTTVSEIHRHLRLHEKGKKQYQCNVCYKKFIVPSVLKRHVIVHSTVKKFNCQKLVNGTECGKAFKEYETLKWHIHTNNGKIYACKHPECTKKFKAPDYMLDHYSLPYKQLLFCKRKLEGCLETLRLRTSQKEHVKYWCNDKM